MTWLDAGHPLAALLAGLAGALLGGLVPRLIGRLPEPEPEPAADGPDADPDTRTAKTPYRDIATQSGLVPLAVALSAAASAVLGASVGPEWSLAFLVPLVPVLVALGVIDWQTRLLPTRLVLPALIAAILVALAVALGTDDTDALRRALISLVGVRSVFWLLWFIRSSGMGFGDVRLSALLGFALGYLGWAEVVIGTYASFVVFIVPGLAIAAIRRDRAFLKTRVPFGPAMILGALLGVAVGPWIAGSLGY